MQINIHLLRASVISSIISSISNYIGTRQLSSGYIYKENLSFNINLPLLLRFQIPKVPVDKTFIQVCRTILWISGPYDMPKSSPNDSSKKWLNVSSFPYYKKIFWCSWTWKQNLVKALLNNFQECLNISKTFYNNWKCNRQRKIASMGSYSIFKEPSHGAMYVLMAQHSPKKIRWIIVYIVNLSKQNLIWTNIFVWNRQMLNPYRLD